MIPQTHPSNPPTPTVSFSSRPAARTTPTGRTGWNDLAHQVVLVGLAAFLYFTVRGLTEADPSVAIDHGNALLQFEQRLGLAAEANLQQRIIDRRWLVNIVNWIYIWGHWPAITATLIWLQRTRRTEFLRLRNAIFLSGAIGLVIFALHPVAPPRLLGNASFVDTITEFSTSYRVLQPPALVNKYAALPSLHVGWNLLVGIYIWRNAITGAVRTLGALTPALMIAAVVLTGNHYLIDAVAGSAIALIGLAAASTLTSSNPESHRRVRIRQLPALHLRRHKLDRRPKSTSKYPPLDTTPTTVCSTHPKKNPTNNSPSPTPTETSSTVH